MLFAFTIPTMLDFFFHTRKRCQSVYRRPYTYPYLLCMSSSNRSAFGSVGPLLEPHLYDAAGAMKLQIRIMLSGLYT